MFGPCILSPLFLERYLRLPGEDYPYTCSLVDALQPLPQRQQKFLAGNAFNIELMSMVSLFLVGNLVERDVGKNIPLAPATVSASPHEEDEDCEVKEKKKQRVLG